jgi:hypothetical protein
MPTKIGKYFKTLQCTQNGIQLVFKFCLSWNFDRREILHFKIARSIKRLGTAVVDKPSMYISCDQSEVIIFRIISICVSKSESHRECLLVTSKYLFGSKTFIRGRNEVTTRRQLSRANNNQTFSLSLQLTIFKTFIFLQNFSFGMIDTDWEWKGSLQRFTFFVIFVTRF